jgi:hypothetical protein
MGITPLAKKLRVQTAQRALILNAPDGYLEMLGEVPEVAVHTELSGQFDFAHLFVKDRNELDSYIDPVLQVITYDAIFWISYPKGSSGVATDLNRDKIWRAMTDKGIRPVAQVSIDPIWSAIRFRPSDALGS